MEDFEPTNGVTNVIAQVYHPILVIALPHITRLPHNA